MMTALSLVALAEAVDFTAYCDTDWAGDTRTRQSTSGYCIFLADTIVSWSLRRQKIVALFSTEGEYIAMKDTAKQLA
jgi:hypothetical protein